MDIRATDSAYLRFLGTGAVSNVGVRPARKVYTYHELKEWDVTDNYLITNPDNNIYNWVFFHPKWKSFSITCRAQYEVEKIGEIFDFVNRPEVLRFVGYYPGFFKVLKKAFDEAINVFKIVGKPLVEAVTDPETGGDLNLIIYFPVENKDRSEIRKLIDFLRNIRKILRPNERSLITCFLK